MISYMLAYHLKNCDISNWCCLKNVICHGAVIRKKITKIQKLEKGIPFSVLIDKQFIPSNKPINSLGLQFVALNYVRIV